MNNEKFVRRARKGLSYFYYPYFKIFKKPGTFEFRGNKYAYFWHWYNLTIRNERAVEIPIFMKIARENSDKNILEVGNVTSHYFHFKHDVLDKYEKGKNVINEDVIDFRAPGKYDLIIMISTLEHVGMEEDEGTDNKILVAIENLKNCLKPGGKIVFTSPIGQNPRLDEFIRNGKIQFSEKCFLARISRDNVWKQVDWEEVKDKKFFHPYNNANGLIFGIISK